MTEKIDKGFLTTLEYYLDKDLYDISTSALKEAMKKKASPYIPLNEIKQKTKM